MSGDDILELYTAIKQDDLALFSSHLDGNENVAIGRFPLLSLIYLYKAKRLENLYFDVLCKVENYRVVPEIFEISRKFKKYAGRALRLYTGKCIISPLEMLCILGQDGHLKKCYSKIYCDENAIENIKKIYSMRSQKSIATKSSIKISGRPLDGQDIRKMSLSCIFSTICIVVLIGVYALIGALNGLGIELSPTKISSEKEFLCALDSAQTYSLSEDIDIYNFEILSSFEGVLDGKGYTVRIHSLSSKAILNKNNGTIKNLNIIYDDNLSCEIVGRNSLLVLENNGTIRNVNITCKGLNVSGKKSSDDTYFNGLACNNSGEISNCNIMMSGEFLSDGNADRFVSGFVGINNGNVSNCTLEKGKISAKEVDISGIVNFNESKGVISNCSNKCELESENENENFSPNVSGISMYNYGIIQNSHNYGKLSAKSACETNGNSLLYIAGICLNNCGSIVKCLNSGDISAQSQKINIYAGGIVVINQNTQDQEAMVSSCGSNGKIDLSVANDNTTENDYTYIVAGGICGMAMSGVIKNSYSLSTFSTNISSDKFLIGGGVGSVVVEPKIGLFVYYVESNVELSNNYVFVGAGVDTAHGGYLLSTSSGLVPQTLSDDVETVKNGLFGLSSKEELTKKEIYWNE